MMKNIRERDELKDDSAEFLMSVSEPGFQHWCGQRPLPDAPLSTHPKFSERCRCFGQNTAALVTATSHRAWAGGFPTQGLSSSQ